MREKRITSVQNNLDIFAVVVEHESLNKASRVLNLSQPALSRKIMHLEEEMGVALFERRGKRLELTRAGRICYDYALRMREMTAEFETRLRPFISPEMPSSITIGASLTTLQSSLPEIISLFNKDHPETDIQAITGKTHEIVDLVRENKADFGLVASIIDHPRLKSYPLFDDHLSLVLPAGHPYLSRTDLTMKDLHQLPMILFSKGTWYRVLMDELFEQHDAYPNVKMEIDSFEAILRLGSVLGCATLLPASYLERTLGGGSAEMKAVQLPELLAAIRTTSLILNTEGSVQTAVHDFVARAQEFYREQGRRMPAK
jgi:LysR family transcriptional regulator, transcriptional activator of the cysJI operon